VLVCYDLLGLNEGFSPKFLKRFAELGQDVRAATRRFVDEVKAGTFPGEEHTFQ
jgi:3-methyl-2-oxobutanoate hydroxymethyltransferase